ncbi:MAG TPA: hypothetical protein VJH37_00435 [Candidatus Nanoarchaeia archaeon]|nr:hypothetical protein [Candidatus Nanoarchaeia archaeon]
MVTFNDLSRICRGDRSRRLLSVMLEAASLYEVNVSADDIAKELQEAGIPCFTKHESRRIGEALERLMPDGKYSPLKGLSKRAEGGRQDNHQRVTNLDRFFYQGQ